MGKFFNAVGIYTIRIFLIFVFLGVFTISFAAIPYSGTLYDQWIQNVFVSVPEGDTGLAQTLSNPTVQRTHTLVDQTGKEVAWGANTTSGSKKSLLIGENFTGNETVKISGPDAAVKITATSGNPELSLGESDGIHGSIYYNTPTDSLRLWNTQDSLELTDTEVKFTKGVTARNKNIVTVFTCPGGQLLRGFDSDANPICGSGSGDAFIWISHQTSACSAACGGGTTNFTVECRSTDDLFPLESDKTNCDINTKPGLIRTCNEQAC